MTDTHAPPALDNRGIAAQLDEIADLLHHQQAEPHRVRAYRKAAQTVRGWPVPLATILEEAGLAGLEALPGVGKALSRLLAEILHTGRSRLLARLEGDASAEPLLATLPGIGPELAHRLHAELGIHSLEELEVAAHDGRLEALSGFGPRRVQALADQLATRLRFRRPAADGEGAAPKVAELLDLDREYRARASAGSLRRIAPKRFNPSGEAWLPILHEKRGGHSYVVLYSNTARAHEQGKTHDWVVIYDDAHGEERSHTVVTEVRGPLRGQRVVRGRERECEEHYGGTPPESAAGGGDSGGRDTGAADDTNLAALRGEDTIPGFRKSGR